MKNLKTFKAVLFDRDGTILNERGYLSDEKRLRFYSTAFAGLRALQQNGFRLVVVTNQSGVGRGYFSLDKLTAIHRAFRQALKKKGIRLAGIYFCPHLPTGGCRCRKPAPGMALNAKKDLRLDLKHSYVVGDQARDVELAQAVGAKSVLVLTGGGRSARAKAKSANKVSSNLTTAARWILSDAASSR